MEVLVDGVGFGSAFEGLEVFAGPSWRMFDVVFWDGGCTVSAMVVDGRLLIRLHRAWENGAELSTILDFAPENRRSTVLVLKNEVYVFDFPYLGTLPAGFQNFTVVRNVVGRHLSQSAP